MGRRLKLVRIRDHFTREHVEVVGIVLEASDESQMALTISSVSNLGHLVSNIYAFT